ncbi:MAG: hypothetical protein AAFY58_03505, partial [Planctomycetota bacterium]
QQDAALYAFAALAAAYVLALAKVFLLDRFTTSRIARRVRKQLRVIGRTDASFAASLERLDSAWRSADTLPSMTRTTRATHCWPSSAG